MSNISGQLIKDSYNYVLQSDLISGIVYRIGGSVAENPKFISGLTVNANFTYSDGSEFPGYVLTCDAAGNAVWSPVSGATSGVVVTGGTFDYSAGTLTLVLSNGVNVPISGLEDIYVTGGVVSGNSIVFSYNETNTFEVSGITSFDTFTSYTASTEQIINSKVDINTFNSEVESLEIEIDNRVQIPTFTAYTATTQPLILNSVTGGTYLGGTLYLVNNSGTTIPISGFTTGGTSTTDTFVTGFSLNSNVITLSQNRTDTYSSFTISLSAYTGSSVSGEYLPLSGGTVTGNTTFTSGLTVNYIDFDTTPNVLAPTGGTVYFDSNENALSYKPITPSNDVTVNLGQESLIRIYNNLGFQINNGQALHVTGATLGVPTVSLAVGTGGDSVQFQISGIATHDIPDSSFGFMTVFGIVRDINLTGFTVGEQIYLSQTVPGGLASYSDLSFTGRTCEVGHILDNSASGKLQVSILNEIEGTIITTQENNILAANNSSTGVFEFSGLSITTPSGTTFNVGPVEGWIIDNVTVPENPTIQLIIYSGSTGNTALYVSSATETYILLTSASTIIQQTTFPTPQQRRQNLYLGKFGHGNRQFLINAFNEPDSALSPVSQLRDMFTAVKLINDGVIASANGANLNINTSAGVLYGLGIGYITNKLNPNSLTVGGQSPASFQYRTSTGGTAANVTLIEPGFYDLNGVRTAISGVRATNQRIYLLQNGQIRIQYGQTQYNQLTAAVAALQNEVFVTFPNFRDNGILIGVLSILSSCNDLTDTSKAQFFSVSKFGELIGAAGGTSTTTLQQAYDNSGEPEITINATLDGLSIKNGTGNADNVTQLLQGVNSGGAVTSFIRADGAISGTTFFGNGGNLSHIFNSVKINGTTQFSANTNTFINFSGINVTISSGANNTIIFSAGTGGGGSGSGTSITGGAFTYTGNTFSGGTLTLTDSNGIPIPISGLRDTFVTGGTYNGSQITFTNNSGSTFVVSGLTASGFSANYYGSFSDSTNQPVSGANTATVWRYNTTELSNGITVVDNTKITVANTGVYEIGYSPQIEKTQGTGAIVTIWAAINGNPVARSSSTLGLVSNSVLQLPFVSFIFELNADDYVEFYFSSDNEFVQLAALSGLTTPTRPDSPSVIIVAKQVGLAVSQGGTGDTFVTGFSLTNDVLTLSQNTSSQYSGFSVNLSGYSPSITGATSVGSGTSIYDSTTDKVINIKSITSDTTNKVSVTSQNQTIELGVNEQNLTLWNLVVQGNKLLNGSVSYVSGLTFSVSPLEYLINGVIYNITGETFVTLSSGDSTFDRIDVIYADISGNTGVLQGVPSANPEKALVDGDTEIEVTFVLVRANSTSADVSTFVIYNENSGPPSEWTFGSGGVQPTRIIGNFTGVTYSGGTSIRVSGVTGAYTTFFRLTGLTELNTNNYSTLQFAIRNLSANTTTSLIRFRFLTTGGTQNGSVVTMNGAGTANVVQYSPTNVSTWQLISIPLWRFYLTNTNVQVLEVSFSPQGTGAQSRYYFDLLEFVEGTSSAPPSNSWTTIQGDSVSTTITAPNPNATLILSGGTNISSSISGTSTVVFNLDNNIRLGGVSATTISATTYQNLPISGLTAGQNINISGTSGNLTISFTGTTGSNFTGGTVSGATNFTNGLTANTISATTYLNLPTDVFVTGGTYTSGNAIFTNNTGGTFTVSGFAVGGGGGQIFYLNLSQAKNSNRYLSTTASTSSEQSTGVTISSGVTTTIASFQSDQLNTILIPSGIWSFHLHSYKSNINATFDIFVEVYKRTSGGTETLLFTTEPAPVISNSPTVTMEISEAYFSGSPIVVTDSIVAVVRATNTSDQSYTITFFTEGSQHYSYVISTLQTQQGLTCDTLSGCSVIQTIQSDVQTIQSNISTIQGDITTIQGEITTINGNVETIFSKITGTTNQIAYFDSNGDLTGDTGFTRSDETNNFITTINSVNYTKQNEYQNTTYDYDKVRSQVYKDEKISGETILSESSYISRITNYFGNFYSGLDITDVSGSFRFTDSDSNSLGFFYDSTSPGWSVISSGTQYTYILPSTPYLANSVLTDINGDGNLSWVVPTPSTFTGGTVSGPTNFISGLTANTISATTYLNLPSSTFTGGTVSGPTNFTSGLTANTISATTYLNLPTDIRVTGATYERNSFTYTNNTGGTFSVLFNSVSGLTVQGLLASNSLSTFTLTASSEFVNYINPSSQLSTLGIDNYSVLRIQGSYIYSISRITGNFQITDVSNPNSPSLISTTSVIKGGSLPNDINVNGRYAYIVYNGTGTTIVDIENVKSPIIVYSADTQSSGDSIYVQGTYQYTVSLNSNRLFIYDISLATSPVLISSINTISTPYDVYIQGNYAYVVGGVPSGALQIIDISTPSSPSIIGSGTTSGSTPTKVYVQGRYAYVSNVRSSNFTVIDVSNPTSPSVVSQITIQNSSDFYIQGNNAYVASNLVPFGFSGTNTTVSVVSISNPNSLSVLSTFNVNEYPISVIVQGKYLYVSDYSLAPQIFDLGSSYIQQLEAGGIETTTLTTLSNATVGNDLTVVGGMNVNQSLNVQGDISARSVRVLPVALTVISNTATTNASQSSLFTLTLTGNTTLATPINGFSGQRILYQLKQDGTGNKLLTLSSGFRSGPITVTLSTAANTTDYLGVIYNAIDNKWDVLALNKGYS